MIKFRVIQTSVDCIFDNLTEEQASYALANLIDKGEEGCSIETYEWLPSESKRLGRDPDLH